MTKIYIAGMIAGAFCCFSGFFAGWFMFIIGGMLIFGSVFCICKNKNAEKSAVRYVRSIQSDTFHRPSCKAAKLISRENLQTYNATITAAQLRGASLKPCPKCKPR